MSTDPGKVFPRKLAYYIHEGERSAFCRERGIDKGRLSRLINGEENVTLETVWWFAQAIGCDPADLISEREGNHPAAVSEASPEYPAAAPTELQQVTAELRRLRLELHRITKLLGGGKS